MPKEVIYDANSQFHKLEIAWSPERGLGSVGVGVGMAITDDDASGDIVCWNDWWCNLDRNGINRMIRALRKARDQQFGADA